MTTDRGWLRATTKATGPIMPPADPAPATVDHGDLTGLLDDDHPQYLKTAAAAAALAAVFAPLAHEHDGESVTINDGEFVGNLAGAGVTTLRRLTDWLDQWVLPNTIVVPIHSDATASITLTNHPSTEQFLANNNRNITVLDLSAATRMRLVARVVTGSASPNSPRLRVRYATAFGTNLASYLDAGTTEIAASLTTAGVIRSAWTDIAVGAKLVSAFVAVTQIGGNGATSPVVGNCFLEIE